MKKVRISSNEKHAVGEFVQFLLVSYPNKVKSISLFGSKARGDSHPGSDIDVMVILDQDDHKLKRVIQRQAARISLEYDVLLNPRIIGEARWKQMRGFTLYQNVIQDAAGLSMQEGELSFEQPVSL